MEKSLEHLELPLDQNQEVIDMLAQDYPVSVVCDVLGCVRSSCYHQAIKRPNEAKLKAAFKTIAAEWPTYGYRRVTAQLRLQEWLVNHTRIQRLMRLMDTPARPSARSAVQPTASTISPAI